MVWIKFIICGAIVIFAGTKLSKYGDAISEKTRLTGAWVGLLLLATITSMPELVAGAGSVAVVHDPNLAIGIVLGSNLFNLAIIAVLDMQYRQGPLLGAASRRHILSAGLSILIIAVAGAAILLGDSAGDWTIGRLGVASLGLLLGYLVSLRIIAVFEQRAKHDFAKEEARQSNYPHLSLRRTLLSFIVSAMVIIGAAIWLAMIGDEIAETTSLKASFVGSLFLAVISSLPELTVCIAALKLGAVDMAVADILGSNMFNTGVIIAVSDLFFSQGSVLSKSALPGSSTGLGWAAMIAMAMTAIIIVGILYPAKRKVLRAASWETPVLLGLWALGAYLLFVS